MKTTATAKFVGTSSRKLNLVAALIRGHQATEATTILANLEQRAAGPLAGVLASAVANAENNLSLTKSKLLIEQVLIGPGPTLKRFRPRARGAAGRIKHRSSHITVVVSDSPPTGQAAQVSHSTKATSKSARASTSTKNQGKTASDSTTKTVHESDSEGK